MMPRRGRVARALRRRLAVMRQDRESGYVLVIAMLVLVSIGMLATLLLVLVQVNQQHVARDKAYTQSLSVAEAGLNQYLWMVASGQSSEYNDFVIPGNTGPDAHKQSFTLTDQVTGEVQGTYTLQVIPPDENGSRIGVRVTGSANSPEDTPRTVFAHVGRPAFSEYVLLVDDSVYIGGPLTRIWHGKTHSNTGIRIETAEINDVVSCAQQSYQYSQGQTKDGVWSQTIPSDDPSRALWQFPVPPIDFNTVSADFVRLSSLATGVHNLAYVEPTGQGRAHGWYIRILSNERYQVAQVTGEQETKGTVNGHVGGQLEHGSWGAARTYSNNGVIFSNDNVWVGTTGSDKITGRLTIACSGQLNPVGKRAATSINIVDNLIYEERDGTVALGLIAQNDVKIPMYAPLKDNGPNVTNVNLEVDAAIIAQQGAEFVSFDSSGNSNGWGPRRGTLTIHGSVSSFETPYRRTDIIQGSSNYAGFAMGENTYDGFLFRNPPPYFPTVGTYQVLDWRELPSSQQVSQALSLQPE